MAYEWPFFRFSQGGLIFDWQHSYDFDHFSTAWDLPVDFNRALKGNPEHFVDQVIKDVVGFFVLEDAGVDVHPMNAILKLHMNGRFRALLKGAEESHPCVIHG